MASGLLIKQKQLLAGDGIAIDHGETASTISLAENALDNAVRIYDATVEAETGVVTITDGTQVSELTIGDEIRTPDGVYQKIKDSITTVSPADGTRIKVSGITTPEEFNGVYILTETEKVWKHESADYWILQSISQSSDSYWMIADTRSPSYPGEANFIASCSISSMPWEMSDWVAMRGYGSPVLENASTEQTITDTLALFEYASLPVKPENIVQSVNGKKPDASGNVTIETSSGGLTSVSVGNGLTGNGTSGSPIKLDLSRAVMEHDCDINAGGHTFNVSLLNEANISATSIVLSANSLTLTAGNVSIFTTEEDSLYINASQILLNRHNQNTAGGFAIVGEDGKLPASIIPVSSNRHPFTSSDLSGNVLTITTTGNVTGVIDDSGKAWNFADEEVTYTDSTVSVDLSGVFARKGIVTPAGTWKLMLYGA